MDFGTMEFAPTQERDINPDLGNLTLVTDVAGDSYPISYLPNAAPLTQPEVYKGSLEPLPFTPDEGLGHYTTTEDALAKYFTYRAGDYNNELETHTAGTVETPDTAPIGKLNGPGSCILCDDPASCFKDDYFNICSTCNHETVGARYCVITALTRLDLGLGEFAVNAPYTAKRFRALAEALKRTIYVISPRRHNEYLYMKQDRNPAIVFFHDGDEHVFLADYAARRVQLISKLAPVASRNALYSCRMYDSSTNEAINAINNAFEEFDPAERDFDAVSDDSSEGENEDYADMPAEPATASEESLARFIRMSIESFSASSYEPDPEGAEEHLQELEETYVPSPEVVARSSKCEDCGKETHHHESCIFFVCYSCVTRTLHNDIYCVKNALTKLDGALGELAVNTRYNAHRYVSLARKAQRNVYVVSPRRYNVFEYDGPEPKESVILYHDGDEHVFRARYISQCDELMDALPAVASLNVLNASKLKKDLQLLKDVARKIESSASLRKEFETVFPAAERAQTFKIAKEIVARQNVPQPAQVQRATPNQPRKKKVKTANPATRFRESAQRANAAEFQPGQAYRIPMEPRQKNVFDHLGVTDKFLASDFQSARWSATPYRPFTAELDDATGMAPYTPTQVARAVAGFVESDTGLPRRFDSTITKMVASSGVVTLTGANYTEGDIIFIVTPNLSANRGALVFSRAPTITTLTAANLIAVIVPAIDTEDLGALQNVNGSVLSVGIQQSTGASSTVSAFSNQFEGAVTCVSPLSAVPGKLAYTSRNHRSLSGMVTDQNMVICNQNYGVPDHLVRTGGAYDKQSNNVLVPGAGNPSALLETGDSFVIAAFSGGAEIERGYLVDDQYATIGAGSALAIWQLSEHPSYLRHLLFGSFHAEIGCFDVKHGQATTQSFSAILHITYIDGTSQSLHSDFGSTKPSGSSALVTPTVSFYYEGGGAPFDDAGKIIVDMAVSVLSHPANTGNVEVRRSSAGTVRVAFDAINAATTYSSIAIVGAREGQTLAINLRADTEITLDPTGDVARYLTPSPAPAVVASDMAYFFNALRREEGEMYFMTKPGQQRIDYEAGAFGAKVKDFFKRVVKGGQKMLPALGGAIGTAVMPGMGTAVGSTIGTMLSRAASYPRREVHESGDLVTELRNSLPGAWDVVQVGTDQGADFALADLFFGAASFTGSQACRPTGFLFPVVDLNSQTGKLVRVVTGASLTKQPDFMDVFRVHLSGDCLYTGASCGLAFLLAAISHRGAPSLAGGYSGEIAGLSVTKNTATFTLLPVDLTDEKLAVFSPALNLVATANGLVEDGVPADPTKLAAFETFKSVKVTKAVAPPGYPDAAYRVSLRW